MMDNLSEDQFSSLYNNAFTAPADDECSDGDILSELVHCQQRYLEKELIDQGGMKNVFRVLDVKTSRHIAMAELKGDAANQLYEPFLREARLTALLEHPNIIKIHDISVSEDHKPYFTMELKVGDSLKQIIKKLKDGDVEYQKRYSLENLLEILIKICDAIAYAHSRNVIHLDLKPDNIQVGNFGEVIVCDWGLGKVLHATEDNEIEFQELLLNPDLLNSITLTGEIRGTPGFMAPEQAVKDGDKDARTDVYALGAILYSLLTYTAPIEGDTETVIEKTIKGEIISPHDRFPSRSIPKSLNAVAMKALECDPDNRYQNVESFRNDIYNFLSYRVTTAENAGFFREFMLFYRRNRAICLTVILFSLCIIGTTFLFVVELKDRAIKAQKANELAQQAKAKEKNSRQEAETSRDLYRSERDWVKNYIKNNNEMITQEVYRLTDVVAVKDPAASLNAALIHLDNLIEIDPENKFAYMQRGYVHFIMQNFAKAYENFSINHKTCGDLFHNTKLLKDKFGQEGLFPVADVISVLPKGRGRKKLALTMLLYDSHIRKDGHQEMVKAIINKWNLGWEEQVFEYNAEDASLRIGGKNLTKLGVHGSEIALRNFSPPLNIIPLLSTLKVKSLDVSNTDFSNLQELVGLPIEKLNIAGAKVKSLKGIELLPELKELVIQQKQFPKNELNNLPEHILIIEK